MATVKDRNERDFRLIDGDRQKLDFNKIKVGGKTLRNDVTMDVTKADHLQEVMFGHKKITQDEVKKALAEHNVIALRRYSRVYFDISGIYSRLCRYMAYLFRYDIYLTPVMSDSMLGSDGEELSGSQKKVVKNWYAASKYLEDSHLKRVFGDIALKVVRDGCFYGYCIKRNDAAYIQELPAYYCRSRYQLNGRTAIEFNVKFFDDCFSDVFYRTRVLKMFPKEIQKAYVAYKNGTLPKDFKSDETGWVLLDVSSTIKFNISGNDAPLFATVIPKLMDLEDAQGLDKKKMLQQILKIVIQKLPIDKDGELIFDPDEAQQLHSNAVQMLADAIGVDVLTTFADVDIADMADNNKTTTVDQLEKVERTVYNEAGTGQNLFNSEGNMSLEKSILNDEATMTSLILQFEEFTQSLLGRFNKSPKRVYYKAQILPTTVYNYKELATQYKELVSLGYSKLLPLVALGQAQSTVIMSAYFENDLLKLNEVFLPPQSSNTLSANSESENPSGGQTKDESDRAEKTNADIESGRREETSTTNVTTSQVSEDD